MTLINKSETTKRAARIISLAGMVCGGGMLAYSFYQGSEPYKPPTVQRFEQLSLELKDTKVFLVSGSTLDEIIENSPFTDFKPEVKKQVEEYLALYDSGFVQDMNLYSKRQSVALNFLGTSAILFIISFQALGYTLGITARGPILGKS